MAKDVELTDIPKDDKRYKRTSPTGNTFKRKKPKDPRKRSKPVKACKTEKQ